MNFYCTKMGETTQVLWVKNQTNRQVNYLVSYQYPDTTIPDNYNGLGTVPALSYTPEDIKKDSWTEVFDQFPSDTMTVFIISTDTLIRYGWQQVRSGYKILKRYDLSKDDLARLNYEIVYP